ncbi:hypothetical protein EDB85DRAFT_1901340 [Lactarius pseudohatsudake]|nr:hypothetical protein EDB85DRAFT_1901340 [Lactarius pseudohatsudake]
MFGTQWALGHSKRTCEVVPVFRSFLRIRPPQPPAPHHILIIGVEQPSLAPLTLFALNSPDTIPEYANGCKTDLASTSIVCFEDYAHPTRAPPTSPAPSTVPTSTGSCASSCTPGHEERHICGGYTGFRKVNQPWGLRSVLGFKSIGYGLYGQLILAPSSSPSVSWGGEGEDACTNPSVAARIWRIVAASLLESRSTSWRLWLALRFSSPTSVFLEFLPELPPTRHDTQPRPRAQGWERTITILFCGLVDIKYSDPILSEMSDNNEQCALRPDGTLKDASKISWLNDPDDAEPIPAHGLGAPSLNLDSNASTTAGSKGKEPAQLVGGRCVIKPTAKAQQASLTGFFSSRTVLIDGKESAQTSSANSGNSGPAKQGGIYNT